MALKRTDAEGSRLPATNDSGASEPRRTESTEESTGSAGSTTGVSLTAPRSYSRMTFKSRIQGMLKLMTPNAAESERLRRQLLSTQEELQSLTEQHQTALEELRSSNEELHSVNEELQSTNEELETSKEELQSVNEELHTVNLQLSEKIGELDASNSDLRNLFDSTDIATIFLDRHLIIRSFTRAVTSLYNLIPTDQGRPVTDILSRLDYEV
jgi:chromosome segregation ATPase